MTHSTANLRKAAILFRSVDADTAAMLLAQLSPAEARALRDAVRALGPVDQDERADVAAEFRRIGPLAAAKSSPGVELHVSAAASDQDDVRPFESANRPFEFLEHARVETLVPYLAREHGQTVAIVLSYLKPARAAEVLVALPPRLQADVVERLSHLGETDPASVQVLERELAEWLSRQESARSRSGRRTDAIAAILAAAPPTTRDSILSNIAKHNQRLAEQFVATSPPPPTNRAPGNAADLAGPQTDEHKGSVRSSPGAVETPPPESPRPRLTIPFDDLARLDQPALTAVLRAVDPELMVLALTGASDTLVDRIAGAMPAATASAFRRRLRQLGPTRLRDVEAAQREVAAVAAETIHRRRPKFPSVVA